MSAVINITVIKPFPSSKLGIAWIIEDNCVKITKVREGGLFWESGLKEGQEIIAINRTHVDGLSWDEVKAIFASIETTISITARTKPFIASFDMDRRMSCDRHQIPEILEATGVPLYKWRKEEDGDAVAYIFETRLAMLCTSFILKLFQIFIRTISKEFQINTSLLILKLFLSMFCIVVCKSMLHSFVVSRLRL